MRMLPFLLIVAFAANAGARTRSVASHLLSARTILVITAHPDDEMLLAPLLANRCVRGGVSCSILVMTTGNAAGLGEVRAGEMTRAAALLNLRLTQWTYSDVLSDVGAVWAAETGDRATLVRRIGDVIAAEQPDMILTLDPNHGTTCHPAHREIGRLVVETGAKNVFFLETAARFIGSGFALSSASPAHASVYAANDDWDYAVQLAGIHATQFTAEQVESLRTLPAIQRRVWFAPAGVPTESICD